MIKIKPSHTTIRVRKNTARRLQALMEDNENSIDETITRITDFYTKTLAPPVVITPNPITDVLQPPTIDIFDMDEYLSDMRKILAYSYKDNEALISKSINIMREKKIEELKLKNIKFKETAA